MKLIAAMMSAGVVLTAASAGQAQGFPGSDVDDRPDATLACHVGVYRLPDGSLIDVAPQTTPALRWRRIDGETGRMTQGADGRWTSTRGWTERVEGPQPQLADCADGRIILDGGTGERVDLPTQETDFIGHGGTRLHGRLILPQGDGPVPIMIEVHGSEGASAVAFNWFQRLSPASGVGVFVYDKRGSGGSEGRYTQDFEVLATDAAAALEAARALAGDRAGRMGFHGGSQGGWIAPLAATMTETDFVVVGFGMAVPLANENRDETFRDLRAAGWGPEVLEEALPVIDAATAFLAGIPNPDFAALDAVRARYASAPWWDDANGEYTGIIMRTDNATLAQMAPLFDVQFDFDHQPLPVLRRVTVPMLWVQAREDTEAPPEETRDILIGLAGEGRPVTVLEYPDTDHGILLFETREDGSRIETGYAPGYVQAVLDWAARGRLDGDYGTGVVLARPATTE